MKFVDKILKNVAFVYTGFVAVLIYPFFCNANDVNAQEVSYKITQTLPPMSSCLNVNVSLKGNNTEMSFIRLVAHHRNLKIISEDKELLYDKTDRPDVIRVISKPKQSIYIYYQVCNNNFIRHIDYPIIEQNFIHFPAITVLATPEVELDKELNIKIDLDSLPTYFKVATSFNANHRKYQINATLDDFRQSMIAAGDIQIKNFKINDKLVNVIANDQWSSFNETPSYYLEKMLIAHRNFWNDNDFPFYSIFLIKQKNPSEANAIFGKHWTNALSMTFSDGEKSFPNAIHNLSHEAFHAWLGFKLKVAVPQGKLQWFIEGVNDFYGAYIAYKSGVLALEDYVEIYNRLLKEYNSSPIKMITNDQIEEYFQSLGETNRLATLRGHFIAKSINDEPNGSEKLKLIMNDIKKNYQNDGRKHITQDQIDRAFIAHLGKPKWESIKKTIESGDMIQPSLTGFYPYAKLNNVLLDVPDFGFDTKKMIESNIINDVSLEVVHIKQEYETV